LFYLFLISSLYFLINATNARIDDRPPRNLPSNPLQPGKLDDLDVSRFKRRDAQLV